MAPHSVPQQWTFHKHFDPRYCLNHSAFLAKGIWTSLQDGRYQPTAAYRVSIPKPSGGLRQIDAFSVPDAAVAGIFLNNLRTRNANVFSDSSYAYQINKSPLHAIINLRSALRVHKVFVSQYDFSQYFDTIQHAHVHEMIARDGPFLTTILERKLLQAVLTHSYIDGSGPTHVREVGIPQGNSLSLFLANVAAHPLTCSPESGSRG
jgi:RNA-directed DNA polymerase